MRTARIVWVGRVPLAFGLDWVPLLEEPDRVRVQARRAGASHLVLSGDPTAALGLARGLAGRQTCWSAADLLARRYPRGSIACVLALDPQTWHVLACHEGVVLTRADRAYPDPDMAAQAIEALRLAYPKMEVIPADPQSDETLQDLARQAAACVPLIRVRSHGRIAASALLVTCVAALGLSWNRQAGHAAVQTSPEGRKAWDSALALALAQRPIHGEQGTRSLLQALYRQPVRLAGWVLQNLRCQQGADGVHWQCRSEYRRQGVPADNRGLLQAALPAWRLEFPSLDVAHASWDLTLAGQVPDPRSLPTASLLARDWASALQAVLPAFTTLRIDPPGPLTVPAPRDERGQALPLPGDLPVPALRTLRVEGPLRSGILLAPLAQAVSWRKASLSHAPAARATLRASRLMLHLEGSVYENHR